MAKVEDNRIPEVQEEITKALERAFTQIGMECMGYAAANAPHDTGLLRNSITYAVDGHSVNKGSYEADNPKEGKPSSGSYSSGKVGNTNGMGVTVGTNVEYAPYQEYGTSRMKAANAGRGFLRPAFEDHLNEYEQILRTELGEVK